MIYKTKKINISDGGKSRGEEMGFEKLFKSQQGSCSSDAQRPIMLIMFHILGAAAKKRQSPRSFHLVSEEEHGQHHEIKEPQINPKMYRQYIYLKNTHHDLVSSCWDSVCLYLQLPSAMVSKVSIFN